MKIRSFCGSDIRQHFRENRSYYFSFFVCFLIGIIIGIIVVSSNESYLNLMTSKNKVLYSYINGTLSISELFWNQFYKFLLPLILIFILGFNYYTSFLSFIFITYQASIFIMSGAALISLFGLSGILNFLLIMLPVNLLYFAVLAYFIAITASRARLALRYHDFIYGINNSFIFRLTLAFALIIVICILTGLIYPLFLKSAIFIIF